MIMGFHIAALNWLSQVAARSFSAFTASTSLVIFAIPDMMPGYLSIPLQSYLSLVLLDIINKRIIQYYSEPGLVMQAKNGTW
jgi:hypothetical protein